MNNPNARQVNRQHVQCGRCNRRTRITKADGWNVEFVIGKPKAIICPACQSPEENAEAMINESTLSYSVDAFGRVLARPKHLS